MCVFTLPTPARIAAIAVDNYRTRTLTLDARLGATPGQFVMAWLPRFDEKPFSLVNADPVTVMITAVGPFTRLVHELRQGDRLWLRGPFGRGFAPQPAHSQPALVGGGYGVAPLLWLARRQVAQGTDVDVVVGARTAADVLYAEHFAQLGIVPVAANGDGNGGDSLASPSAGRCRIHVTTEDGSCGEPGLVTDRLAVLFETGQANAVFACGPHGMLAAIMRLCRRHDVPCQLSWEAYMRCGIGICGACEHEGKLLCLDGPVLHDSHPADTPVAD